MEQGRFDTPDSTEDDYNPTAGTLTVDSLRLLRNSLSKEKEFADKAAKFAKDQGPRLAGRWLDYYGRVEFCSKKLLYEFWLSKTMRATNPFFVTNFRAGKPSALLSSRQGPSTTSQTANAH